MPIGFYFCVVSNLFQRLRMFPPMNLYWFMFFYFILFYLFVCVQCFWISSPFFTGWPDDFWSNVPANNISVIFRCLPDQRKMTYQFCHILPETMPQRHKMAHLISPWPGFQKEAKVSCVWSVLENYFFTVIEASLYADYYL